MPQIKALSDTLRSVAAPGMTPKALRAAVREKMTQIRAGDFSAF